MRGAVLVIALFSVAGCAPKPAAQPPAADTSLTRPWVTPAGYPANESLGTISAWLQAEYVRRGEAALARVPDTGAASLGNDVIDSTPRPDVLPPVEWTRLSKRCRDEMVSGTPQQQFEALCMLQELQQVTAGRPDISATFPKDYDVAVVTLMSSPDTKVRSFAASMAGGPSLMTDPMTTVPALLKALDDKEAEVRKWAASSLCSLSLERVPPGSDIASKGFGEYSAAALAPMLHAIPNAEKVARLELFTAIGNLGEAGRPAVPALIRYLNSDDRLTRVGALRAMEGLGPVAIDARPHVARLLRENAGGERSQAGRTLTAIEGGTP